jgi:hypothetical protein
MWMCAKCERAFQKINQPHSCKKVSVRFHFEKKEKAKKLFYVLLERIENNIGKCRIISLPCCIHLFGSYDFLAALPKKDSLEIRFALNHKIKTHRLKVSIPLSKNVYKNCFNIQNELDYDQEFINWLRESYHLKD